MNNLFISAYGRSNVGKKRGNNEDNFYLSGVTVDSAIDITSQAKTTGELAFAVFDGMGGEAAGEKASQSTAVTYGQKVAAMLDGNFSPAVMQNTIDTANKKVCDEIRVIGKRMGCTFVSVGFKNDNIYVSNVGDSRAYLFRNGKLHCISKDHTVAQTMVDAGLVSYEESQKSKEKHKLTQHIGIFPDEMIIEPYYNNIKASPNDLIVLCSDGLTDMLTDADIESVLARGGTEEFLTNALVEGALANGGKDNVTVIVAKVSGGVARPAPAVGVNPRQSPMSAPVANYGGGAAPVAAPTVITTPVAKKSGSKFLFIIGGAVVGIIALIAVIFFVFNGRKDDNADKKKDNNKEVVVQTTTEKVNTDDKPDEGKPNNKPEEKPEETPEEETGTESATNPEDDENISDEEIDKILDDMQDADDRLEEMFPGLVGNENIIGDDFPTNNDIINDETGLGTNGSWY